jgi:predicted NBD/HSP70 family sugar kinase
MPDNNVTSGALLAHHGAARLTSIIVDTYNAELRDGDGFIGDRASKRAFAAILDDWRERLKAVGEDPLGDTPTEEIKKKELDRLLTEGDPETAGIVQAAIEDFAQELATVIRRFLRIKAWQDTQRIVMGGGLRASRIGELAIKRAGFLVKADGHKVDLVPIRYHPNEAGLVGCIHLAPSWIFAGHDSILAVDIGGTNIRVGVVELNQKKAPDLSKARVVEIELWRHAVDKPKRDEAVERLGEMLLGLVDKSAKAGLKLAPFIGIGCPGIIQEDGGIKRGGQNLPGNWESSRFNLPQLVGEIVPKIGEHETVVVMHNDAVVQGLSEVPWMQDVEQWGVLTIGTGLGNARFTNRGSEKAVAAK